MSSYVPEAVLRVRDLAPFGVRIPPELKERLAAEAKANNRSMNSEILQALELWLTLASAPDPLPPDALDPPPDLVSKAEIKTIIDAAVRDALAAYQKALDERD